MKDLSGSRCLSPFFMARDFQVSLQVSSAMVVLSIMRITPPLLLLRPGPGKSPIISRSKKVRRSARSFALTHPGSAPVLSASSRTACPCFPALQKPVKIAPSPVAPAQYPSMATCGSVSTPSRAAQQDRGYPAGNADQQQWFGHSLKPPRQSAIALNIALFHLGDLPNPCYNIVFRGCSSVG